MEKEEARRKVRKLIRSLTAEERAANSQAIFQRVRRLPEMREARVVMGFLPLSDELNTRPILEYLLSRGGRVYVPRKLVHERRITPVRLTNLNDLRNGAYGIPEPVTEETCAVSEIDFILVPARAFDRRGNRLGRGGGFYDRLLARDDFRALRCGLAFSCQVLQQVPTASGDLPVHILVTENETLRFSQPAIEA